MAIEASHSYLDHQKKAYYLVSCAINGDLPSRLETFWPLASLSEQACVITYPHWGAFLTDTAYINQAYRVQEAFSSRPFSLPETCLLSH
jgi:hypothetical protein